ncbi:MAG: hypothetical protein HUU20_22240, partial [Pirellulales bacterium]|nr:hypothetical protein [Pirellulales bacterium]
RSGRAIKLTAAAGTDTSLGGWHNSGPDRSTPTTSVDNAITNGRCTFEFWIHRPSSESGLSAFLLGDERDVALRVAPETGALLYQDRGKWVASEHVLPPGDWQRLAVQVDLDHGCYSASIGTDDSKALCRDVKYDMPKARSVVQPGVNIPIAVPVFKTFDSVLFIPEGRPGSVAYLDDVSVEWTPTLHYAPAGKETLFTCDFESYPTADHFVQPDGSEAGRWQLKDRPEGYYVASGISFGEGVKSLHARGGMDIVSDGPQRILVREDSILTVDCDVFIRSSQPFPFMIPNPSVRSDHRTTLSLCKQDSAEAVAALQAGDGTWRYQDGDRHVDSRVPIAYDVWNHVQMALDMRTGVCAFVVQPVGELPTPLGRGHWSGGRRAGEAVRFSIAPSGTPGHISCYDNVVITCARGDE